MTVTSPWVLSFLVPSSGFVLYPEMLSRLAREVGSKSRKERQVDPRLKHCPDGLYSVMGSFSQRTIWSSQEPFLNTFLSRTSQTQTLKYSVRLGLCKCSFNNKLYQRVLCGSCRGVIFTNSRPGILTLSSASPSMKCQYSGTVDNFSQKHRWRAISKEQESFKMITLPHPTPLWRIYVLPCKGREHVNKILSHSYLKPKLIVLRPLPTSNALKCGVLPNVHLNVLESQEMRCFS